ncbi:hypothetical protein Q5689_22135 [Microcoleus sp. ARI1-A2]
MWLNRCDPNTLLLGILYRAYCAIDRLSYPGRGGFTLISDLYRRYRRTRPYSNCG